MEYHHVCYVCDILVRVLAYQAIEWRRRQKAKNFYTQRISVCRGVDPPPQRAGIIPKGPKYEEWAECECEGPRAGVGVGEGNGLPARGSGECCNLSQRGSGFGAEPRPETHFGTFRTQKMRLEAEDIVKSWGGILHWAIFGRKLRPLPPVDAPICVKCRLSSVVDSTVPSMILPTSVNPIRNMYSAVRHSLFFHAFNVIIITCIMFCRYTYMYVPRLNRIASPVVLLRVEHSLLQSRWHN